MPLPTKTVTDFTRTAYLDLFESTSEAIDFENAALSVGRSLLPPCAVAVLDGKDDGPDYYAWLIGQAESA